MFDEVENYARLLKIKQELGDSFFHPAKLQAELERVMHDMSEDYRDRTDECLPTLARKRIKTWKTSK